MSESEAFSLIFYALIGITGAFSLIFLVWGFITYISRLGTERRSDGLDIMEWAVGCITASIILIGILRLFEHWIG